MATAISVHIDPTPAPPGTPAPPPPTVIVVTPELPQPVPPPPNRPQPPAPSQHGAKLRVGLAGAADMGTMPATSPAVAMQLGARWRVVSISGEGRVLLPVTTELGAQKVQARTWAGAGSVVPCGHIPLPLDKWNIAACGLFTVGAVHAEGLGLATSSGTGFRGGSAAPFYAGAGARLSLEFPVGGPVLLRVTGEVLGMLRPAGIEINDKDVLWTGARLAGGLGAGVVADFF
jgi:hypothetical protein